MMKMNNVDSEDDNAVMLTMLLMTMMMYAN